MEKKKQLANSEFQIFDGKCPSRSQNLLGFKGHDQEKKSDLDLGNSGLGENEAIPLLKILKQRTREVLSARGDLKWSLIECETTDKADRR